MWGYYQIYPNHGPIVRHIELQKSIRKRNPLGKGNKSPNRILNENFWLLFLEEARIYILGLTDDKGTQMYNTKRKTAFIGLLCDIHTIEAVYTSLVKQDPPRLKYLLTYKLSQDHIELFFGAVRASLGCNNNPTVRQFTSAYKRLLMRHSIEGLHRQCNRSRFYYDINSNDG